MGVARIVAHYLALPEDAQIAQLNTPSMPDGSDEFDVRPDAPGPSPSRPSFAGKRTYVDPIVRRNIFDSSKVGAETTGGDSDSDRKTDLKVVLLATVVAEPDTYSSALIAEEKGKEGAVGYGLGDELLGEATIYRIEQRRVIIKRTDGTLEYIAMEEGKSFSKEGDSGGGKGDGEEDDDGIEKAGDNKFIVDQEVIDAALENPEKLYSQIRAVPHKGADGEIDGYRLSGIRRKSVFHNLGIKNGDVVHSVNGKGLDSMQNAMEAYNSLQNDKNFSFEITRRNQRQTFEYEIR